MGQVAINDKTKETLIWKDNAWQAIPTGHAATNDAGEIVVYDGQAKAWVPYHKPDVSRMEQFSGAVARGLANLVGFPNTFAQAYSDPNRFEQFLEMQRQRGATPEQLDNMRQTFEATAPAAESIAAHTVSTKEILSSPVFKQHVVQAEPTDAAGRVIEAVGQGVGGGAIGGPAGMVGGALAGGTSQGLAEVGAPEWVQAVGGLGVPLVFGGISSAVRKMTPAAKSQLGKALEGVTKDELAQAENLMRASAAQRNPLSWAEALNKISGGRFPELAQLQRTVEQTSGGGGVLAEVMNKRLGAARMQAESNLANIAPRQTGQALADVPANTQSAAMAAIRREQKAMRAVTKPAYQAAALDEVPQAEMARIVGQIDKAIAETGSRDVQNQLMAFRKELVDRPAQAGKASPLQGVTGVSPTAAVPETYKLDVGRLDSIRKSWRDKIELPNIAPGSVEQETASKIGPILSDLRDTMKRSSDAFNLGRSYHEKITREVIEPLRRNVTGQLAEAPATIPAQRAKLLPTGEQGVVDAANIRDTVARLERERPGSAAEWLRTNLQSQLDETLKAFASSGADQSRGAALWAKLTGNSMQRANIRAYVEALPNGAETWKGFETMLDTLDAQRYRLPSNSATSFNTETIKALQGRGIPFSLEDLNPVSLLQGEVKEAGKIRRLRLNSEKVARVLIDPNAREQLVKLAKLKPNSREARRMLGAILVTSGILEPEGNGASTSP